MEDYLRTRRKSLPSLRINTSGVFRPNLCLGSASTSTPSSLSSSSFPPLPSSFYQNAVILDLRFTGAKEKIQTLSEMVPDTPDQQKFLKGRIDKQLVDSLFEDREAIELVIKKLIYVVQMYSELHTKRVFKKERSMAKKHGISISLKNKETYFLLMNHQISKLVAIFKDMKKLIKKLDFFISRLQAFSNQSFVVTSDFLYTLKIIQSCVLMLQTDIQEMESFLVKRKEGYNISQTFSEEKDCRMRGRSRSQSSIAPSSSYSSSKREPLLTSRSLTLSKKPVLRIAKNKPIHFINKRRASSFSVDSSSLLASPPSASSSLRRSRSQNPSPKKKFNNNIIKIRSSPFQKRRQSANMLGNVYYVDRTTTKSKSLEMLAISPTRKNAWEKFKMVKKRKRNNNNNSGSQNSNIDSLLKLSDGMSRRSKLEFFQTKVAPNLRRASICGPKCPSISRSRRKRLKRKSKSKKQLQQQNNNNINSTQRITMKLNNMVEQQQQQQQQRKKRIGKPRTIEGEFLVEEYGKLRAKGSRYRKKKRKGINSSLSFGLSVSGLNPKKTRRKSDSGFDSGLCLPKVEIFEASFLNFQDQQNQKKDQNRDVLSPWGN